MTDIEKLARWMGWHEERGDWWRGIGKGEREFVIQCEDWNPTTDDADALMLVDRAIELGWGVSINSVDPELWQGNLWECIFQASGVSVDESWLYEHADTRPAAISAAVLRVIKEG